MSKYQKHLDADVKGKHRCHITWKFKGSVDKDCDSKIKLTKPKQLWLTAYYARTTQKSILK